MSFHTVDEVTVETFARQFGFEETIGNVGKYTWRIVIQSVPEASKCRLIMNELTRGDVFVHHRRVQATADTEPGSLSVPFEPVATAQAVIRDAPSPIIQAFFQQYAGTLIAACTTQANDNLDYVAFSAGAQPIFRLLKEATFLPEFAPWVHSNANAARKLHTILLRKVVKLLWDTCRKSAEWVARLRHPDEVGGSTNATPFEDQLVTVFTILLPSLINLTRAIVEAPGGLPPQHAGAATVMRTSVDAAMRAMVNFATSEDNISVFWLENGEMSSFGDRLASLYNQLATMLQLIGV
ncbi:hypothetical protein BKA62DRAFT_723639 [Auriculariales sp. MPI-PUGE-AT-0066]|nr:hypothetical protein BKA62DRAFT_723639 [Auriculariales sp. MPI-PUGE-AT-0066]